MKTVYMGLNTEPDWVIADEVIQRFKDADNEDMIKYWCHAKKISQGLRDQIIKVLEEDGECELSWSCTGRTRHEMHAHQWAKAMPEYDFEIGYNYHCVVRKKVKG